MCFFFLDTGVGMWTSSRASRLAQTRTRKPKHKKMGAAFPNFLKIVVAFSGVFPGSFTGFSRVGHTPCNWHNHVYDVPFSLQGRAEKLAASRPSPRARTSELSGLAGLPTLKFGGCKTSGGFSGVWPLANLVRPRKSIKPDSRRDPTKFERH